jgi:hypothetical protein
MFFNQEYRQIVDNTRCVESWLGGDGRAAKLGRKHRNYKRHGPK